MAALHGPAARAALGAALDAGVAPGDAYAHVVRPAVRALERGPGDDARMRLAHSIGRSAVADLALRHPDAPAREKACGVLTPPGIVGELDARLLADALEADGWDAVTLPLGIPAEGVAEAVRRATVGALLVPASDADQLLSARLPCATVRRLPDPPLVVGVQLETRADAAQLPVDALVTGMDALRALLDERLAAAPPRWGVRLARDSDGLTVSPTGVLDAENVARLREVVDSRLGLYDVITIDLAALASCPDDGLEALSGWRDGAAWDRTLRVVGDDRVGVQESVGDGRHARWGGGHSTDV